ncbi:MAG TPA: glycosyl hydrolase [Acidothermaceae bacterium]|nr:glycosyl hydrolase [Acidothermaceae bacterium]
MFTTSRLSIGATFLAVTALAGLTAAHQLTTAPVTEEVASAKPAAATTAPAGAGSQPTASASHGAQDAGAARSSAARAAARAAAASPAASSPAATRALTSAATTPAPSNPTPFAHSGPRIATNAPHIVRITPTKTTSTATTGATGGHAPLLGVYAGPDSKGVAGAAAFGTATGVQPQAILDFSATDSWANLTAPSWLISAHSGQPAQFELALPMLPDGAQYTLATCASGGYDAQWRTTASNLINHQLASTIVRPGWEFNGNWYHWSAKNDIAGFIGCFRHIVDTMRSVPGQQFRFDWNPDVGLNSFPAEQAYPGDAYVDYVGVDVYDYSWSRYPAGSSGLAAAREAAWNDLLNGNHGLAFWSAFAAAHHKPMAVPEWAAASRTDGHGGGDNASFIDHVFDFIENPANHVAYMHYFNTYSSSNDHSLTAGHLPAAAAEYGQRAIAIG